jgi:UDP-2,3-diacylglucosamine hydrolase
MSHKLLQKAVIVGDVHFDEHHQQFLTLLEKIKSKEIKTPQLILLGDIFDLLFGGIDITIKRNQKAISIIADIAKDIEVVYFEGNHDFNLQCIFEPLHVKSIPISEQPALFTCNEKVVALSHGDVFGSPGYNIYTSIVRSNITLKILSFINTLFGNFIINNLDKYLNKKIQCKEFENFEQYITNKIKKHYIKYDYVIEAHYHQNKTFKIDNTIYTNISAFACKQRYFVVQSQNNEYLLTLHELH